LKITGGRRHGDVAVLSIAPLHLIVGKAEVNKLLDLPERMVRADTLFRIDTVHIKS
jgi:hypothetical protein